MNGEIETAELPDEVFAYLAERLPGGCQPSITRLAAGHSNVTYVVRSQEGREWVMRRPPRGPVPAGAHDVLREAGVLRALEDSGVRLPRVELVCSDPAVLGVPFYLMERLAGEVVRADSPDWFTGEVRRHALIDFCVALAEVHNAPVDRLVSARLGRASGYLERQLRNWSMQSERLRARPHGRALGDSTAIWQWLRVNAPAEPVQKVVHGDYKLDNVLIDPVRGRVTAILDWEMATVGDPLADLGFLLLNTPEPGTDPIFAELSGTSTAAPGCPSHAELVDTYFAARADMAGRDARLVGYYKVLAGWKLGVLLEASYQRHLEGTADDPFFGLLGEAVPRILAATLDLTHTAL